MPRYALILLTLPMLVPSSVHAKTSGATSTSKANASTKAPRNVIAFDIVGLKAGGTVRCALFTSSQRYLKKSKFGAKAKVNKGQATCRFVDVPPATYAMATFHDANNNGKLDTNWMGIPSEGVCASNSAKGSFGPPKWKDAKFVYRGGSMQQRVRINY